MRHAPSRSGPAAVEGAAADGDLVRRPIASQPLRRRSPHALHRPVHAARGSARHRFAATAPTGSVRCRRRTMQAGLAEKDRCHGASASACASTPKAWVLGVRRRGEHPATHWHCCMRRGSQQEARFEMPRRTALRSSLRCRRFLALAPVPRVTSQAAPGTYDQGPVLEPERPREPSKGKR